MTTKLDSSQGPRTQRGDFRTLRLLEAIEAGAVTTQRQLARDVNMSLGLVNAFVKELARKGHCRIDLRKGNKARYLLTPEGLREKRRLTYKYLNYSIGFYREIKGVLQALFSRLQGEGVVQVAFYGCGELAELAYLFLHDTNIGFAGVFDETGEGRRFYGHPVKSKETIASTAFDYVLLTHIENVQSHREGLLRVGVPPGRVLQL